MLERTGKVITELFEQREREFLLSPVRVMIKSSMDEMEIGDMIIGRMKQGEIAELPRWAAEELAELNIAEIQEEAFDGEIFKALTREKMLGSPQLSPLQANFYLRMRRRLATMKTGSESGKYRREDYEKLKATCYDLIGRRLNKLLSISSSANMQTIGDKITPEEKVYFASSRSFSDEWKNAILGDRILAVITRKLSDLFEELLRTYQDKSGVHKYRERIAQLAATGDKSVVVDYEDIIQFNTDLGERLLSQPDESLKEFRMAAYEVLSTEDASYAGRVKSTLNVRIRGITDRISLRKVDTSHLDKMIAVAGMVVRSSELRPLLMDATFVCPNGHLTRVIQEGLTIKRPIKCDGCEETRNLDLDEKRSSFIDSQVLRVQELPEELPPGQLPRFFDVDVVADIVNTARPGDRIVLSGIVRAEPDITPGQPRTRVFRSKIDSNLIEVAGKDPGQIQISKEDELLIKSIAANPDAYKRLIRSMAPAILGHDAVKEAILLLLVGGPQTILPDGTKLRGDINIFIVGDPGVAKSEMLKFAAQVSPRGMFASGKGSTAAGLSAAVIREKNTFMLEAGVVVLADQGVACIDEFDKMKPEDRSALHEQMEQQTVTIAKGGIYATLNARTAILAAANPVLGKYDPYKNLTENITLPTPLLTRFDLIFVLKDTPSPAQDERLATHILDVHRKRGYTEPPPVQFDLLKKYIAYTKKISPSITTEAEIRIKEFYLELRRSVTEGQIGATPRTLESLIRLASSRARLLLRDQVLEEDALAAIALMNKMVEDVLTDTETKTKGDFGILLGQPAGERGKLSTSMEIFRALEGSEKKPVELKIFRDELVKSGRFKVDDEIDKMIQKLIKEGIIWENRPGFYRRVQA